MFFSENLINCDSCFGCINLRHKRYCIFNEQHSKDSYFKTIKEFNQGSYQNLTAIRDKINHLRLKYPFKYLHGIHNVNITGDYIDHSKNCKSCFVSRDLENSAYSQFVLFGKGRDSYDITIAGGEMCYEIMGALGYKSKFMWDSATKDLKGGLLGLTYCMRCMDCSNLFGCVGLRNKQYCILNKQYSKDEYLNLVSRIMNHMDEMPYVDKKGRVYKYGEFFPPELSPFAYNETIAQEYFPLTKEQAIEQGYRWKDPEPRNYQITITPDQLPDHIKDVPDSITEEIIQCSHYSPEFLSNQIESDPNSRTIRDHSRNIRETSCNEQCTTAFKIIRDELQFLRKMNLPLPRLCPNCRHYQRLKQRNPLKLWHRRCMCSGETSEKRPSSAKASASDKSSADKSAGRQETSYQYGNTIKHFHGDQPCQNEFETSYAPERPEIVYCEQCYNAEVV